MTDYNFTPNSHKFKEGQKETASQERKKVDKVISGTAKVKKKSGLHKVSDIFISEDARNVKTHILTDVLVPVIRNTILDIIIDSATMIFKGESGRSRNRYDRVSYSNYYDRNGSRHSSASTVKARTEYSYDDITVETRGEADEVLFRMNELLDLYGVVTIADLNDLVGITGNYTDNKYGWTSLRHAEAVRVRDGYKLRLPRAIPID